MKKINFKNPDTQNTIGVVLMITAVVLFICLQVYALQSTYSVVGTVDSIGEEKALQIVDNAESLIQFSRVISPILFLAGILFIAIAFKNRRKT